MLHAWLGPCARAGHSPFRLALKLFCPLLLGILCGEVHIPGCGEIELTALCPMEVDGVSIWLAAMLWTKGADRRWCYIGSVRYPAHVSSQLRATHTLSNDWHLKQNRNKNQKWAVIFYLSWPTLNNDCVLILYLLPYKCTKKMCLQKKDMYHILRCLFLF